MHVCFIFSLEFVSFNHSFFLIIWVNLKYFSHESTRTLLYVILVGRKWTFHAYLMCSEAHILTLAWCKNSFYIDEKINASCKKIESKIKCHTSFLFIKFRSILSSFRRPVDCKAYCETGAHHMSSRMVRTWPIEWQLNRVHQMDFVRNEKSNARKCKKFN